jgi:hypothetical protein
MPKRPDVETDLPKRSAQPPAHGPGPPQRPHIPGMARGDLEDPDNAVDSAPTANTLSERFALRLPHSGHATFESSIDARIDRTSFSNVAEQSGQLYS